MSWEFGLNKIRAKPVSNPLGYSAEIGEEARNSGFQKMLEKKLLEVATAGKGQILLTMFMMWMLGSTISVYLLIFIGQGIYTSFSYLLGLGKVFAPFQNLPLNLTFYKALYLGVGILQMMIVLYKVYSVGLFPNFASDWIDLIPVHHHSTFIVA